tara:strand:+ start:971 stop:1489 length:519 start_codon:yes stop_codon:yes gene_type:complete
MKTKNVIIGSGVVLGGVALYYFFFKKGKETDLEVPQAVYVDEKSKVVVSDTSVLDSSTIPKDLQGVANELAPKVETEADKKKEELAQYFKDEILKLQAVETKGMGSGLHRCYSKGGYLNHRDRSRYKAGTKTPNRFIQACLDERDKDIANYKMKLQQIGYDFSYGNIYKIRK